MVHRKKMGSFKLFMLFLGFSLLLSSATVPTTRGLKLIQEEMSLQGSLVQGAMEMKGGEAETIERRIDIESSDYEDPGANHDDDPKLPPGKP